MNKAKKHVSKKAKILKKLGLYSEKLFINILFFALVIITFMLYCWSILSLYFNLPWEWLKISGSILLAVAVPVLLIVLKPRRRTFFIISAVVLAITVWQQSIPPSNDRDWKISVARIPQISINGNEVKISNIRNFDYRSVTDFTPRYYTRTFNLDNISSLDYILSYWDGNKAIAHTIFSFGFNNGDYLAVSVETRLSKKQKQSTLSGIFNQYEMIYILSDERDVIRLRTNFRKEQVYLYRLKSTPDLLKKIFLKIIKQAADLQKHPRFYNTVKHNCLTTLQADLRRALGKKYHFDYRFIMNGYSDKLLYDKNVFMSGGFPFEALKKIRHINQYVENDPDAAVNFSSKIRPPHSAMDIP
jgi:Domain of unknown function (DUF4105)